MNINTIVVIMLAMSLWAPHGYRLHLTHPCVAASGTVSGSWLPMASGLAAGDGDQVTDRYLGIAFSRYSPDKGCSECPELLGAGKPSNRTALMGLHELLPGGAAWSRKGLGSEPRSERVSRGLGIRMHASTSN